jgi:hypothetical protein
LLHSPNAQLLSIPSELSKFSLNFSSRIYFFDFIYHF